MRVALLLLTVSLAMFTPPSMAQANADEIIPWTEATFATQVPPPYGRVQVSVRLDGDGRLAALAIASDGHGEMPVPREAIADVQRTQISQVKVTFKNGFDGVPWLFIHIPFGTPTIVRGGVEWPVAVVAFRGNKPVYRALSLPRPDGGFDWRPTDLPR